MIPLAMFRSVLPVRVSLLAALTLAALTASAGCAHGNVRDTTGPYRGIAALALRDWQPRPMLVTRRTARAKPLFAAIDVHTHVGRTKDVAKLVAQMDALGVQTVVNLDGGWGEHLAKELARFDRAYPGRFLTYALLDFSGIDQPDWGRRVAAQLERDFQAGARGLKLHKSLGLTIRQRDGRLLAIDDTRLDGVWRACAKYQRPVEIHVADPAAFFTPLDRHNERWHELNQHPDWLFHGPRFPSREELWKQRNRVIARHPKTIFIGAHMGNAPEDLARVGRWLQRYPNFYVDIDARINELGRQPYTARRFLLQYQDRVLFGTDTSVVTRPVYETYYRFLETDDEYFDTAAADGRQGFWMVYGLHLPREVLRKLYRDNARRLLAWPRPTSAPPTSARATTTSPTAPR